MLPLLLFIPRSSIHSSLHRIIHMDCVWQRVLHQTESNHSYRSIPWVTAMAQRLQQDSTEVLNNDSVVPSEIHSENIDTNLSWNDLTLLYHVTDKEGWYMTKEQYCYYIVILNQEKQSFKIVYPRIHLQLLLLFVLRVVILYDN